MNNFSRKDDSHDEVAILTSARPKSGKSAFYQWTKNGMLTQNNDKQRTNWLRNRAQVYNFRF